MKQVDVNADLGESFGPYVLGRDEAVAPWITSANIACGFHAGDPQVMARTVELCLNHGVALGAHPGLPDLQGFGRREMEARPGEIRGWVLYQVGALAGFARDAGSRLRHVKPHGALYHMGARSEAVASEIATAVRAVDPELILLGPPRSRLEEAGRAAGLRFAREAFPERAYLADGSLAPRCAPGARILDPEAVAERAESICLRGCVAALDGANVCLEADTLCLHGDTPGAGAIAQAVRLALEAAGVAVRAL